MKTRLLSILLVFLLVMSFAAPAVSANSIEPFTEAAVLKAINERPYHVFLANPYMVKLAFDGITILVSGAVLAEIGMHLGKTLDVFDETVETLNKFASDVGKTLNGIFSAKGWVSVNSGEGRAVMTSLSEGYSSPAGGGKKDDKWYFEARKMFGKIKIKTERMDENQAVEAMKQGKDIMTLDRELAQKVVGRFNGLSKEATDALESQFETHHEGVKGYFSHLHYYSHGKRLHCWSWK